ncbi:uncharacterized protein LOC109422069 isoform X2 [Aedes albopictus]|uniref:Peptidase S1 domain-containing protein n=1 Tax=Aedes albopictus TaxID=7160 RepID=A0ABM1ZFU6_AEDAL
MCKLVCFLVLSSLCLPEFVLPQATYQCGIRQHGVLPLVSEGNQVEEGHWPWHAAVYQRLKGDDPFKYGCGGTLVNERHVLTAAHCVVKRISRNQLPAITYEIELHFGQHQLSNVTDSVIIRDVSKAHVHPEYALNRNDIAVLAMRLPVDYSDTVIPICLDQKVDRDLRELEGQRGWITGWGKTENGNLSDVLQTASMPVVSYVNCLKDDPLLYGHILNENVFCAGNKNKTGPGPGDSGGGMYISDGDRWILRGIVSLGKYNELKQEVDPLKYTVFVNVQPYLTWIKEVIAESEPRKNRRQKRISELECERFQSLSMKLRNGDCVNNRYRHDVLIYNGENLVCNGVLVEENHVITTCSCIRSKKFVVEYLPLSVVIDAYGTFDVLEMFCHPKHIGYRKNYDIAVLKLEASIVLSYTMIPACLANNWTENLYDILVQTLFVSEPTSTFEQGKHLTLIESTNNRLTLEKECTGRNKAGNRYEPRYEHIFNRSVRTGELCVNGSDHTLYKTYAKLIETASSGAVLQTFNRRSCVSTIVGLLIRNVKKKDLPSPSWVDIYARISSHLDWIEQNVWNVTPRVDPVPILGPEFRRLIYGDLHTQYNVEILHWSSNSSEFEPRCSGTVMSVKHVLTAAQCVMNQTIGKPLAADTFELRFGEYRKGQRTVNEYVRYVSEVHVHPERLVNDIAILVASWPVRKTEYVAHSYFMNSTDYTYSDVNEVVLNGWSIGKTGIPNNGSKDYFSFSTEIRQSCVQNISACTNILILDRQKCLEVGLRLSANQFCAGYSNEEVRILADRGSGMRLYINFAYVLAGVVSSEMTECERFSSHITKHRGACWHLLGHIVKLYDIIRKYVCVGVLVRENRILTSCQCTRYPNRPSKAKLSDATFINITKKFCHPNYNSTSFQHDLAILELATPVDPKMIEIACLANVRTEQLLDAVVQTASLQKAKWKSPYYASTYEYFGTEQECARVLQPPHNDTFLKPGQTCVINNHFKKDLFSGSLFQSVDNRNCTFTVVGIGSTAVHNRGLIAGRAGAKFNIGIVHRVAYYLDWIEQVVWQEEFGIQHKWRLVNTARNAAARKIQVNVLSFAVLVLGVHFLVHSM